MGRRKGTVRAVCTFAGCRETAFYEYDGLDERARLFNTVRSYRCVRHTRPDDVVSVTNRRREMVLTVGHLEGCRDAHFWMEQRTGFISGPGFKAFATDFPIGTKIRVTCELLGE